MNNKLVFVGIMAIVAAVGLATTVIPFQSAQAAPRGNCGGGGISVNVACGAQVCANAAVLAQGFTQFCQNQ